MAVTCGFPAVDKLDIVVRVSVMVVVAADTVEVTVAVAVVVTVWMTVWVIASRQLVIFTMKFMMGAGSACCLPRRSNVK